MRRAHTVEQVRAAEAQLMARLPQGALMERAATGLAYAVIAHLRGRGLGGAYGRRVLLLVGSGDNGGDALYAGALLARRGAAVEAWLLSERVHAGGVAALRNAGGRVVSASEGQRPRWHSQPDVVVDGIVGIGGKPGLRAGAERAVEAVRGIPVVAVDTPSGVGVDTGETAGAHVTAELTVTFGTHKVCHLVDPAAAACGDIRLVDIGLEVGRELPSAPVEALDAMDVAALLPRPSRNAYKYTRGVVGLRVGSATYPGAALLAVAGADSGLAGMVRYVGSAADVVKQRYPEVVGDGRAQAWVVGSGGGEHVAAELAAARETGAPLVVDADALRHVTGPLGVPTVLTPHAGELAAMLGRSREEVEAHALECARHAAERYAAVVLLKGRRTVIAEPSGSGGSGGSDRSASSDASGGAAGRVRVNTTGTPWLATAGAGDVLGGLVGALLAAGSTPFDAASVGAWVHGAAAALAGEEGPITASDVARAIPSVVGRLPEP